MHRRYSLLAILVVAACSKDEPKTGPVTGSGSSGSAGVGPASGAPATPPGTVEVFVDDASVAKVSPDQLAKWPRLDSLVPDDMRRLGTWQTIYLRGAGEKPTEISRPSVTHAEAIAALFPGADGKPAFGMFDPVELAKKGKPTLQTVALREVRIVRSKEERGGAHQGGGSGEDPMKLVLTIKTAGGDKPLTGEKILAIPRESQPGHEETKGWTLTKLLAAAGVTKFTKLVLIDAAGTSVSIDRKDFDDKTTVPFIKLNRQGSLRFRMMKKKGEGWQAAADLRALTTIKVDYAFSQRSSFGNRPRRRWRIMRSTSTTSVHGAASPRDGRRGSTGEQGAGCASLGADSRARDRTSPW
jgi:hypothetical protein